MPNIELKVAAVAAEGRMAQKYAAHYASVMARFHEGREIRAELDRLSKLVREEREQVLALLGWEADYRASRSAN
jgi:hypothetical protein